MSEYQFDICSDITEKTFIDMKRALDAAPNGSRVDLMIGSYGGEVFSAFSMLDYLHLQKGFKVTAYIIGRAMTAAAFLAIGCDRVVMSHYGELMFHSAYNETGEIDKAIVDTNTKQMLLLGKRWANVDPDILNRDTFISPDEALAFGLADAIIDNREDVICKALARFNGGVRMNNQISAEAENVKPCAEDVVEEVVEEKCEDEAPATDVLEVIEKLADTIEEMKQEAAKLAARVSALENPEPAEQPPKDDKPEEKPTERARINALASRLARLTAPSAEVTARAEIVKPAIRRAPKGFDKYINSLD